jgi:hypothetical protein
MRASTRVITTDVACEIQRYLGAHPNAADTAEGIAQWWLSKPGRRSSPAMIQVALNQLVSEGRINRSVLADGTVLYRSAESV